MSIFWLVENSHTSGAAAKLLKELGNDDVTQITIMPEWIDDLPEPSTTVDT